ncbi:MAG: hypothetical protein KKC26_03760 [Nanoarchaeota archaeon]|nr:hypothetical protein [Nanoarchaeota archaeon]MBU1850533.1 hypothetical protein [Nanoarchaeota archaeon]
MVYTKIPIQEHGRANEGNMKATILILLGDNVETFTLREDIHERIKYDFHKDHVDDYKHLEYFRKLDFIEKKGKQGTPTSYKLKTDINNFRNISKFVFDRGYGEIFVKTKYFNHFFQVYANKLLKESFGIKVKTLPKEELDWYKQVIPWSPSISEILFDKDYKINLKDLKNLIPSKTNNPLADTFSCLLFVDQIKEGKKINNVFMKTLRYAVTDSRMPIEEKVAIFENLS